MFTYYCVETCKMDGFPNTSFKRKYVFHISKKYKNPNEIFIMEMRDSKLNLIYSAELDETVYLPRSCLVIPPGLVIYNAPHNLKEIYEDILDRPGYWGLKIFKTDNKDISDFFLSCEKENVVEYMNSEEFIKEFYSPHGIGGKRDKEELESFTSD